jgi:dipeptidyl aminopeptidase/acylaminoacyl peptidase
MQSTVNSRSRPLAIFLVGSMLCRAEFASAGDSDAVQIPLAPSESGARRAIRLEDLIALRDIMGMALSPDGKHVVVTVKQADLPSNDYKTGLWLLETAPGGRRINLGSIGPVRHRPNGEIIWVEPRWSPDSVHFVIARPVQGIVQLCAFDTQTLAERVLTSGLGDVASFDFFDADTLHFLVDQPALPGEEAKAARRAFQAQGVRLDRPLPYWGGSLVDRAYVASHPATPVVKAVSMATRQVRELTAQETRRRQGVLPGANALPPERFSSQSALTERSRRWAMDTGVSAYTNYELNGTRATYVLFVQGPDEPQAKIVRSFDSNQPVLLEWRGRYLYFTHADKGLHRLARVEWPSLSVEYLPGSARISYPSISRDGKYAAFVSEQPTLPGAIVLRDLENGSQRVLLELNPELRQVSYTEARRLEWKNQWGDEGYAYLVYPAGYVPGKKYPLVVVTYRAGGFLRGGTGDEYPIHVLAANGFAVLVFDVGPGHFRRRGSELTQTLRWLAPTDGLKQVLQQVDKMGLVDPGRRGTCGLSFGADLSSYWISQTDWFSTAITSGGSWDPAYPSLLGVAFAAADFGGDQPIPGNPILDSLDEWKKTSPAMNVDRIFASLLINVADLEILASTQLVQAMNDRKKAVEMWIFPDEFHVKNQPQHRWTIYNRNVDWFRFWLQGHEDPSPEKAAQYARWRKLRELREADLKKRTDAAAAPERDESERPQ